MFDNDILFSQGDQAEEVYFIFRGSCIILIDLSEIVDMNDLIKKDQSFNVPLVFYNFSSYFGDNDVLTKINGYRTITAIC